MASTKDVATTTILRRCTGSARFGIDPHEAPVTDFPEQPSRKDGLGTMCTEHWRAYVKGLAAERKARAASEVPTTPNAAPAAKAATKRERRRTPMAHVPDPKVVEAEALIAEVDALPADQMVKRVGDDDVQAALESIGKGNGRGHEPEHAVGTPLGEDIDSSIGEADAA